jgi:predicted branched-subunit amino acid permease
LIYGVLALNGGLSPALAAAMPSVVFAGSAQFMAAQLIGSGAPGIVILSTTFIVNLRHVLYGAAVAPHLKHLSLRWTCLRAYLLADEVYEVAITRRTQERPSSPGSPHRHCYVLGAARARWSAWQASTAVGIALVVPALTDRPGVAAALAAGWPSKLGLVVAAISDNVVGVTFETRQVPAGSRR